MMNGELARLLASLEHRAAGVLGSNEQVGDVVTDCYSKYLFQTIRLLLGSVDYDPIDSNLICAIINYNHAAKYVGRCDAYLDKLNALPFWAFRKRKRLRHDLELNRRLTLRLLERAHADLSKWADNNGNHIDGFSKTIALC